MYIYNDICVENKNSKIKEEKRESITFNSFNVRVFNTPETLFKSL